MNNSSLTPNSAVHRCGKPRLSLRKGAALKVPRWKGAVSVRLPIIAISLMELTFSSLTFCHQNGRDVIGQDFIPIGIEVDIIWPVEGNP